jgi:hypothetical protein
MKNHCKRNITLGTGAALALVLTFFTAACSSASATTTPKTTLPVTTNSITTTTTTRTQSPFQQRGTSGIVAAISGNLLIIDTTQGQVNVYVDSTTVIEKTVTGAVSDLAKDNFVTISGTADSSGIIAATLIMLQPQRTQGQTFPSTQFTPPTGIDTTRPTGGFPGGGGARQMTIGTIAAVNGNMLTVTATQGDAQVKIDSNTVIQKTVTGSISDLQNGVNVTVMGNANNSGTVIAASISIRPAGQDFSPFPPVITTQTK